MKRLVIMTVGLGAALSAAAFAAGSAIVLPTGWRIAAPPASVATLGTMPTGVVLSRDGRRAFVLEAGHQRPTLRIIDPQTLATVTSVPFGNAFGLPLRDAAGSGVWVANTTGFGEQVAHVDAASGKVDDTLSMPVPFFASAMALTPNGATLAVAGDLANRVAFVDTAAHMIRRLVAVGRHPAALQFSSDARTLYVANRAERTVDAVDVATATVRTQIVTGLHPSALALRGDRLFVANSDDDDIATIDTRTAKVIAHTALPFFARGIIGASPNALLLDADRLYVSCGAANALAVFRVSATGLVPLGALPVGWYPTGLARAGNALLITDGKGEGSHPNVPTPSMPRPYIADNLVGAIRRVPLPSEADLRAGLAEVRSLGAPYGTTAPPASAIVRAGGPIKHVIYVIKENRTYDQVLGDIAGADGDPSLVMYGRAVTPNEHALSERFGIFDRFFDDAHVSADGHSWSTAAFANDYLEKMWPPQYANRRPFYDFEDGAEASIPHAGNLWDDVVAHHLSLRNYGEYVTAGPNDDGTPVSTTFTALASRTDRRYPAFNMHIADVTRFGEWKREFDAFEARRALPALEIVRLPRDHTSGTRAGEVTPEGMVADNDRALGLLIDTVSHSADWPSTAVFVLEDDAQDGPDHIDEQRSTFYLASPYAAGGLQHSHYTTSSVLRTIELMLGLSPMSAYDAGARPLFEAFSATPNLTPFTALAATIDTTAVNKKTAYRAAESERLDFAHADAVDEATLNDILWHAARGSTPHPTVGAFR